MKLQKIEFKTILNSLGKWTIEISLTDSSGNSTVASVPQGESFGEAEALTIDPLKAEEKLNSIKADLLSKDFNTLKDFDTFLIEKDGTANKSELGANLILALSIAATKLFAKAQKLETYEYISSTFGFIPKLPKFFLLIFEGGKHGSKYITAQEFMLITESVEESMDLISKFKHHLDANSLFTGYGLEGAFTSSTLHDSGVLSLIKQIAPDKQIAIDIAEASREGDAFDFETMLKDYNIFSIEDPKDEKDYLGWKDFYLKYSNKIRVVADDLTTSNKLLIKNAQKEKMANAVIIKPNQIGTITETIEAIKTARQEIWTIIVSHRGGDTNDDFITDLAVGVGAEYVKFGGLQRGERIAKFNRWLDIKKQLQTESIV
ncbi:hypothetical protein GW755_02365 [bacterium]|nr:hypothetical protein [bacterium]